MKKVIFLFSLMNGISFLFTACSKDHPVESQTSSAGLSPLEVEAKILAEVQEASSAFADGTAEQSLIFSENEFALICREEDRYLNIWNDDQLRKVMPINEACTLSYKDKLDYLRSFIPSERSANEGSTVETFSIRNGAPARFDATPDVVAQVIAASGTIVGVQSSLNMWRPTFPFDNGAVTSFDITRSMSGVSQSTFLDQAVEYIPESVQFEFQVSGGNWLIGADIAVTNGAGQTTIVSYGFDSPNGPLIWNPTLESPADDDLIQGPMPQGIVSISANGLTPPLPVE